MLLLGGALLLGCGAGASARAVPADRPPAAARALITRLHMEKIPHEGAWFVQTLKSGEAAGGGPATDVPGERRAYSAIYLLLTHHDFSAMHRLATDEVWHFYGGEPATLLLLYPDGHGETRHWGSNVLAGEEPQILVPRGTWMGAMPGGAARTAYTFGGNMLSPGFDYADYEQGYRDDLIARYPDFARQITELTRQDALSRPADMKTAAATPAPVQLEELVGRTAPQHSDRISGSRFVISAGHGMPGMMTRKGHEVMFVVSGQGSVQVGHDVRPVTAGSVIYLPPRVPHSINAVSTLVFYVAAAPAWRQSDTQVLKP
ncbi:cupin domain-containing protein [Komagataeibacter intermedius]|uniref:cupin domain-containing protein n=1 Tax=Komagataeibacter intermedius TaxID=66229 RepID=UPI000A449D08|nr:cupin domain-containing protein [Komagataeibacter intermedius]MCF3636030.1 cupin domain-containing protein [Komagataeibacter intermedius]